MDENDNVPETVTTPLLESVKEDTKSGTAVALVTVSDKDGGKNGIVHCALKARFLSNWRRHITIIIL